ncbi:MAG TPA: Crp/Fnr family transcriptional regulator [candidate division Zixibacteria bacterium]|nr:Crp/Fnr family transcriptional regulator [candidate division Zixibacteria bacterium]
MDLPSPFDTLDSGLADALVARARRRRFRAREIVFHEGDPGDSIQIVLSGHFALRVTTAEGHVYLFRIYARGDVFGRVAVAPIDTVRAMTALSLGEGETLELFRPQVDELRADYPVMNDVLLALSARDLYLTGIRLLEALYVDADRRVRRRLLELGEVYGSGAGRTTIPLTQADIAALAGASRATVNRVLGEEARFGTIERRRGKVLLLDAASLAQRAY